MRFVQGFSLFLEKGGIQFLNSFWDTLRDVPENTSSRTLSMVGDVVAEVVYRSR